MPRGYSKGKPIISQVKSGKLKCEICKREDRDLIENTIWQISSKNNNKLLIRDIVKIANYFNLDYQKLKYHIKAGHVKKYFQKKQEEYERLILMTQNLIQKDGKK
ncbi:MAG TPA: hypothetical protein P5106_09205 [Caldisericia bacterium]|nr:hypothetical protein [Caldisericia bacterium]